MKDVVLPTSLITLCMGGATYLSLQINAPTEGTTYLPATFQRQHDILPSRPLIYLILIPDRSCASLHPFLPSFPNCFSQVHPASQPAASSSEKILESDNLGKSSKPFYSSCTNDLELFLLLLCHLLACLFITRRVFCSVSTRTDFFSFSFAVLSFDDEIHTTA